MKHIRTKHIALCLLAAIALTGCGNRDATVDVPTERAVKGPVSVEVTGRGELRALVSKAIRMPIFHGRWRGLKVTNITREGTWIKAGDPLFVVDSTDMEESLLRVVTEELTEIAKFQNAEKEMILQQQFLNSNVEKFDERFRETCIALNLLLLLPTTIKAMIARNTYEMAGVTTRHALEAYTPAKELARKGLLSGAELERRKFEHDRAVANEHAAKLSLGKVLLGADPIKIEQARVAVIQARYALEKAEIDRSLKMRKQRMSVENARWSWLREKRSIERLKESIDRCAVSSPVAGTIVYQMVRTGRGKREKLREGMSLYPRGEVMRIDDTSRILMRMEVEESDILKVEKGMKARVTVDALPGKLMTGVVHEIAKVAHSRGEGKESSSLWTRRESSGIRVFDVDILLDDTGEDFKPGYGGSATIIADRLDDVLSVPVECVFKEGDNDSVYVRKNGRWEDRGVKVSLRTRDRAVITQGLKAGDEVATASPFDVGNGKTPGVDRLKVISKMTVEETTLPIVITEIGSLRPRDYTIIKAPISGEITYIAPDGTQIKKGDLVLKIDDSAAREEVASSSIWLRSTKAQLEYARLEMEHTRTTFEQQSQLLKAQLHLVKEQLRNLKSLPRPEDRLLAEADVELIRINLEGARRNYARSEVLAAKGLVSEVSLRESRLDKEEAEAGFEKISLAFEILMKGALDHEILVAVERVRKAEIALNECLANQPLQIDLKATAMTVDQAYVDRVHGEIARSQRQVDRAAVFAPSKGTIVYRGQWEKPEEGRQVYRGDSVIELTDLTRMVVITRVHEVDMRWISIGQKARVRLEAMPERVFDAKVLSIAGLATDKAESLGVSHMTQSTGVMVFAVTVEITEEDERLMPSLTAAIDIIIDELPGKLTVPLAYLQRLGGKPAVYVSNNGVLELRVVKTGARGSKHIVIEEGLKSGEVVCLVRRGRRS